MPLDLNDPTTQLIIGAGLIVLLLLLLSLRAVSRLTKAAEPLSYQMNALGQRVQALGEGQERLAGGLHHVSEAQAKQQTSMLQLMEKRFWLFEFTLVAAQPRWLTINEELRRWPALFPRYSFCSPCPASRQHSPVYPKGLGAI